MTTIDEYIAELDEPLGAIAASLKAHLDTGLPETNGKVWHDHPVWLSGKEPVAGFKAYANYVTFMLWRGQDIDEALAPTGSGRMGTLKITNTDGFDGLDLDTWISKAAELAAGS